MTEPIFDLVIADLRAREAQGAETYGKARMEAHDGRDTDRDAYEEALDLAVYLRKRIVERDAMVAAVVEQVQAGKHVTIAEHVIESDEDYARRMGWVQTAIVGGSWERDYGYMLPTTNGWLWHRCQSHARCQRGDAPTLRAAVDAYAQALAEVGEDENG